jgi:hypothetical protein
MRWLPLLVVLASLRADARPVRRDLDFDDEYRPPPKCAATSSWSKFARCQLKTVKFELLHDLPTAKLVAYELSPARASKRLELYVLSANAWIKSSFYSETNATSELLAFQTLAPDTYRLDVGHASSTWVTLDEVSQRPAQLRRQFTYVCSATIGCRQALTSCEVLVYGKAVASFRAEPIWDGRTLKLRGDVRNTNRYCAAPRGMLVEDSEP